MLSSVVLPLPLAPMRASISPGATDAVMPLRMHFSSSLYWRALLTDCTRFRDMIEASPSSGEITQDLEVICGLDFDVHLIVSLGQGQAGLCSDMRLG